MSIHWWLSRVAVVVSTDDDLSCIVGDEGWVSALVGSNTFERQRQDTSARCQLCSNMVSSLAITNVAEGNSEETTSDDLRSID
jgi:hypothetical protein